MEKKIAIYDSQVFNYPTVESLFRPDTKYPEYIMEDISVQRNMIYHSVRECLILMGLDAEHTGTKDWNPLGAYVKPGNNVLIKPNLVMDGNFNPEGGTDCLYTQPGVVAAVIDYTLIALKGRGQIIIGDAPMQECQFKRLVVNSGYDVLVQYYQSKGYDVKLVDFRELSSVVKDGVYYSIIRDDAKGKIVQLGVESDFYKMPKEQEKRIRITNYDPRILPTHHHGEIQEYYISDYVLNADVIINMPKPKTHRKAGVTISLKNFVGANVRKEYLPHHTTGSVEDNGDEYLKKSLIHKIRSYMLDKRNIFWAEHQYRKAKLMRYPIKFCSIYLKLTRNKFAEGSWYGNHTISRTISDINKIVMYADKQGVMREDKQRQMVIIADMIISGEKEGPVNPTPKKVGIVAVGDDPLLFDETITTIMGFDIKKIPTFERIRAYDGIYKIYDRSDTAMIVSNKKVFDGKKPEEINKNDRLGYEATSGWIGHIEI